MSRQRQEKREECKNRGGLPKPEAAEPREAEMAHAKFDGGGEMHPKPEQGQ